MPNAEYGVSFYVETLSESCVFKGVNFINTLLIRKWIIFITIIEQE